MNTYSEPENNEQKLHFEILMFSVIYRQWWSPRPWMAQEIKDAFLSCMAHKTTDAHMACPRM